ncbi:MAG: CvpA family protein [Patescibacteria group bacterium]|nr:MAG: CvpA family protein [Patescibacteria group bacterium]
MTILDLILILSVFAFVLTGLWFGFVHALGAVIGMVLSVLVAGRYYDAWGEAAAGIFFGNENLARMVMFLVLMILVNRLIGAVFWLIGKIFKLVSIVPFVKTFNAILGGLLGFVEGVLVVGGALYIAARYPISTHFAEALSASNVGIWLLQAFGLLAPLLPEAVRQLKSVI